MTRSHTHWDGGPVCRYPTKRECDEAVREYLARRKQAYEIGEAERLAQAKADRIARFDAFIESERLRGEAASRARSESPTPSTSLSTVESTNSTARDESPTPTAPSGQRRAITLPPVRATRSARTTQTSRPS